MTTLSIQITGMDKESCLSILDKVMEQLNGPHSTVIANNSDGESVLATWNNHTVIFTDGVVAP